MNETKFDGKGEIYAQFRPSYPQTCIDALFAHLHWTQDDVLADIGAGTGKLTQLLLLYRLRRRTEQRYAPNCRRKAVGFAEVSLRKRHSGTHSPAPGKRARHYRRTGVSLV